MLPVVLEVSAERLMFCGCICEPMYCGPQMQPALVLGATAGRGGRSESPQPGFYPVSLRRQVDHNIP